MWESIWLNLGFLMKMSEKFCIIKLRMQHKNDLKIWIDKDLNIIKVLICEMSGCEKIFDGIGFFNESEWKIRYYRTTRYEQTYKRVWI